MQSKHVHFEQPCRLPPRYCWRHRTRQVGSLTQGGVDLTTPEKPLREAGALFWCSFWCYHMVSWALAPYYLIKIRNPLGLGHCSCSLLYNVITSIENFDVHSNWMGPLVKTHKTCTYLVGGNPLQLPWTSNPNFSFSILQFRYGPTGCMCTTHCVPQRDSSWSLSMCLTHLPLNLS